MRNGTKLARRLYKYQRNHVQSAELQRKETEDACTWFVREQAAATIGAGYVKRNGPGIAWAIIGSVNVQRIFRSLYIIVIYYWSVQM